ncbi:SUKH-3 domain-containing protein [Cryptosporangium sp. NPDC051539]|uniref:SUKH-3 domain-containing protein n=1 Tax=Cryptosporangium sp. NPDC051539 TaxID=3363962 RepID=UPI0037B3ECA1
MERAIRWLGAPADRIALREFDHGWVAWVAAPTRVDPAVPPDRVGDARVVVDRESGEVTSWPPLPVDEIIARSTPSTPGRFPEDVTAHLRKAGWYPGRRIAEADIERFDQRIRELTRDDPPELRVSAAARPILEEFGGLTIGVPGNTWRVHPIDTDPDPERFAAISTWQDEPVTPVAELDPPDPGDVVVGHDGRVFIGDFNGSYYLAEDFDWAVVRLIRGEEPLPSVRAGAEIHFTDYAGRPIDPSTTRRPEA